VALLPSHWLPHEPQLRPEEVVAILAGATTSPPVALGWVAPEWVHGADAIGMVETGMAATGTAIGIIITMTMMSSSLAASAFHFGGAGVVAGAIPIMVTATATRTVITDTDTPAMDTAGMGTVTTGTGAVLGIATGQAGSTASVVNIARPLARELTSYNGGSAG